LCKKCHQEFFKFVSDSSSCIFIIIDKTTVVDKWVHVTPVWIQQALL